MQSNKFVKFPSIAYLDESEASKRRKDFPNENLRYVLIGEKKYMYSTSYVLFSRNYYNFRWRSNDVVVASFPRSGTTWTQELVWLLSNDLNYSVALSEPLHDRFPFLEVDLALHENQSKSEDKNAIESYDKPITFQLGRLENLTSPRYIKTHFPFSLIPGLLRSHSKIVYVARNPKDVAVSYYHFSKNLKSESFKGDFDKYWYYFQNDLIIRASYWKHLKEAWAQRDNPNVLFVFYEELSYNLIPTLKRVAAFLGKSYTDAQYERLADHLNVENARSNAMIYSSDENTRLFVDSKSFIRKGKAEAWHDTFTPQLKARANRWIEENLSDTDLEFPYIDIYA